MRLCDLNSRGYGTAALTKADIHARSVVFCLSAYSEDGASDMGDSFQTIVICQDPGDGSRDVIINLTPDVLAAMNARLGDTFSIELVNGSIVLKRVRSMNPTYRQMELRFTVASPVSSSTAAALRSPLPTRHAATAPVRGAATYRAPGR